MGKYLAQATGSLKVTSFVLYEKGEGLEKREEDFAAEIEKMVNKG